MISVILPYRDAGATIDEALASVLAEPEVDELVAVDDASRDDGPQRVARAAARDRRIVRVSAGGARHDAPAGIARALAAGLAAARGELIARMDADDVSLPGRFAAQRALLAGDARLAAVGARVDALPAPTDGLRAYVAWQNALVTKEDHAREIFVESPLCHPSTMLRRAALDAVGGWRDAPWPEDYDLWLRLDAAGWGLAKIPRTLLVWRTTPGRATFTDPRCAPARLVEARACFLAARLRAMGRPVCVWGAGKTGKRLARALERHGLRAELFVDIDARKIGGASREAPVVAPGALVRGAHTVVVAVGARGARAVVRGRLTARGFVERRDFVCAA